MVSSNESLHSRNGGTSHIGSKPSTLPAEESRSNRPTYPIDLTDFPPFDPQSSATKHSPMPFDKKTEKDIEDFYEKKHMTESLPIPIPKPAQVPTKISPQSPQRLSPSPISFVPDEDEIGESCRSKNA